MDRNDCFTVFLCLLACFAAIFPEVYGARGEPRQHYKQKLNIINNGRPENWKLFVFGDSYADTGNWPPTNVSTPWREPYGMTFPGKPSGRWCDGRVLTDYIASHMGIGSPQPYAFWKVGMEGHQDGMNFAYGGTGAFDTHGGGPNLTTQINYLQQLLQQNVYTKHDLSSSLALVSSVGNDYGSFHGDIRHIESFVESLTRQLSLDLKRIHGMGFPKVAVTAMQPVGCLPGVALSTSNYPNCDKTTNNITLFHNQLLKQSVEKLNNQTYHSPFVILDLYAAFTSALNIQNHHLGNSSFENPLMPCCTGYCGAVDNSGKKEYKVCDNPKKSFFWDMVHPSQQGWFAVYSALKSSLHTLLLPPYNLFNS